MKVLVFSDSHRALGDMRRAVEKECPDFVIHLGDHDEDARLLGQEYPTLAITGVPGNCDGFFSADPLQKLVKYGGISVLMSHGHIWNVKKSMDAALIAARRSCADVVMFGHTHVPLCRREEDGLWVLNPGSIRDRGTYAVMEPGCDPLCRLEQI